MSPIGCIMVAGRVQQGCEKVIYRLRNGCRKVTDRLRFGRGKVISQGHFTMSPHHHLVSTELCRSDITSQCHRD